MGEHRSGPALQRQLSDSSGKALQGRTWAAARNLRGSNGHDSPSGRRGFGEAIRPKIAGRPATCPTDVQRQAPHAHSPPLLPPPPPPLLRPATTAPTSRLDRSSSAPLPVKATKVALGAYANSARRLSSLRRERRPSAAAREEAAAWRARQMERLQDTKAKREEECALLAKEVEAERRRMAQLKAKLNYEAVPPRYNQPPKPRSREGQDEVTAAAAAVSAAESRAVAAAAAEALGVATAAQAASVAAERAALNRAIRERQEAHLAAMAREREQDLLNARKALARREEARQVAQQAVLDDIAAFRERGGLQRAQQRRQRVEADRGRAAQEAAQRSVALQGRGGGTPGSPDDAARWRRRAGVDAHTPVFIADGYGEPVARKLLARGWAQNSNPGSCVYTLMFVRRASDVPFTNLSPGQIANHFRGSDLLTTKSGLHQIMLSLRATDGCHPATFYPRSYYFAERRDHQMLAFLDDFKDCAVVALLWLAAISRDGFLGQDPGHAVALEPSTLEMALRHVRWRLCCLGQSDAAEGMDDLTGRFMEAMGAPPRPATAASGAGSDTAAAAWDSASPLTEYQWGCVQHLTELLQGVLGPELAARRGLPELAQLEAEVRDIDDPECTPAWQAMRRRVVHALGALVAADPQAAICGPANAWVVKPCGAARGAGVKVLNDVARVVGELQTGPPRIVQKYVERPLLLSGRKADLRVWVVVLSFQPLVAYVYDQVMVRPASGDYSLAPQRLGDVGVHLCNHSVQASLLRQSQQRRGSPAKAAAATGSPQAPSSLGGTDVVATIEAGKVRYLPATEAAAGSLEAADAAPEAAGMLALTALLPSIAAVTEADIDADAAANDPLGGSPGWRPSPALRALLAAEGDEESVLLSAEPEALQKSPNVSSTTEANSNRVGVARSTPSNEAVDDSQGSRRRKLTSSAALWATGLSPTKKSPAASALWETPTSTAYPSGHHALRHMQRCEADVGQSPRADLSSTPPPPPRRRSEAPPARSPYVARMLELQGADRDGWAGWRASYWPAIRDASAAALAAAATGVLRDCSASRGRCFELYGFDFLLDGDGKRAWLLEINESPDLRAHSQEKSRACSDMLDDLVELVGAHAAPPPPAHPGAAAGAPQGRLLSAWEDPPLAQGGWERLAQPQQ